MGISQAAIQLRAQRGKAAKVFLDTRPATAGQVAYKLGVTKSTAVRVLEWLVKRGECHRTPSGERVANGNMVMEYHTGAG